MHIKKYCECNKCMLINRIENLESKRCTSVYSQLEDEYEWKCTNCDLKNHPYDFFCVRCDKKKASTCMLTKPIFINTELKNMLHLRQLMFKNINILNSLYLDYIGISISDSI